MRSLLVLLLALPISAWSPSPVGFCAVGSARTSICGAHTTGRAALVRGDRSTDRMQSRVQAPFGLQMAMANPESKAELEYEIPPGCRRLRMEKPLGIVFEEVADDKGAYVVEVGKGSSAERAGVKVGERLVAVSATTLKAGTSGEFANKGYGGRPFDNWEIIMYPCMNENFRQILKAFASNNERWGINHVSIVLQPPEAAKQEGAKEGDAEK
mmetsp:Transcript_20757/g.40349  ORF Transcript_20757/g.40349 Transcript_20757/m.40349 type:complete len:212 (-) Transcript_20757:20-655(-)